MATAASPFDFQRALAESISRAANTAIDLAAQRESANITARHSPNILQPTVPLKPGQAMPAAAAGAMEWAPWVLGAVTVAVIIWKLRGRG